LNIATGGTSRVSVLANGNINLEGAVGINMQTPQGLLHVHSSGNVAPVIGSTGSGPEGAASFRLQADSGLLQQGPSFVIYDNVAGQYRMVINGAGNVGIGTTTSLSSKLHVEGGSGLGVYGNGLGGVYGVGSSYGVRGFGGIWGVRGESNSGTGVYGASVSSWAGYFQGNVYVTGNVLQNSDVRLKQDVASLGYGLREVLQLRPVTWNWKDKPNRGRQLGLIAQEVEAVFPELVTMDKDSDRAKVSTISGWCP
jgi:hypothetical protein